MSIRDQRKGFASSQGPSAQGHELSNYQPVSGQCLTRDEPKSTLLPHDVEFRGWIAFFLALGLLDLAGRHPAKLEDPEKDSLIKT